MRIELEQKIADAGFPREVTVDALIEELGYELRQLTRHTMRGNFRIWQAKSGKSARRPNLLADGQTAKEALAKLWLKLNVE